MKRMIVVFSIVLISATTVFAGAAQPEKLSKQQLNALITSAKTPAEHNRIAAYYQAEARYELAQAQEHAQMAAQYKRNSAASSSKFVAGTVNHCEYLAQHFKTDAAKMEVLAQEHAQMAREAEQK